MATQRLKMMGHILSLIEKADQFDKASFLDRNT